LAELLAEAKALKERYGITLKDACHRLYMQETSRLETIDTAQKTLAVVRDRIDKSMDHEIRQPIENIDRGEYDDYINPYGGWPTEKDEIAKGAGDM
jgi:hypothetical protein